MREAMAEQQVPKDEEGPKETSGGRPGLMVSPCIHHLAGRREAPAACSRGYDCYRCPVHESVGMSVQVRPASRPHSPVRHASGYKVADDYYYHFGHTWVRIIHGECVKVGVDDFAGRLFGTADAFEVLETGMSMKQAEVGLSLIRGNNQAPVLSPLSGKVLAINQKVLEHPEVLIEDPYQDGWLFQLEPYWLKWEAQGLFHGEECLDWMEQEHRRLLQLMGPGHENLASTGGEPVTDVIGHFPDLGWDRLVLSFLRTGPKADQD
jgi:glycine cleavage system H lipoate-binding protein